MSADKTFTCKAVSRLKPSTMYMTGSAVKELGRQVDKGRSTAKYINVSSQLCIKES